MSKLKRLIEHQRIRVDAHEAGTQKPVTTKGLHIDKTFTEKRLRGKRVKIGIVDGEIETNLDSDDKQSVLREIRDVLKKNKAILADFAETVADALSRWSSGKITVEEARDSARAIAGQLGLKAEITEEIVRKVGENLEELLTIHRDEGKHEYWLHFTPVAFAAGPGKGRVFKGWEK